MYCAAWLACWAAGRLLAGLPRQRRQTDLAPALLSPLSVYGAWFTSTGFTTGGGGQW